MTEWSEYISMGLACNCVQFLRLCEGGGASSFSNVELLQDVVDMYLVVVK